MSVAEVPLRIKMDRGCPVPLEPGECEPHAEAPRGYLAWHEWAERKGKTHVVRPCHGCGLWAIWEPRSTANLSAR